MLPPYLEYLALLFVYLLLIGSLFTEQALASLRKKSFWQSFLIFGGCWTILELIGLRLDMWRYSTERLCGVQFLGIPLEEYLIFFLIHLATISSWEAFRAAPSEAQP